MERSDSRKMKEGFLVLEARGGKAGQGNARQSSVSATAMAAL